MWAEGAQNGPGVVVNSIGTYCEAVYIGGAIAVSSGVLMYIVAYDVRVCIEIQV